MGTGCCGDAHEVFVAANVWRESMSVHARATSYKCVTGPHWSATARNQRLWSLPGIVLISEQVGFQSRASAGYNSNATWSVPDKLDATWCCDHVTRSLVPSYLSTRLPPTIKSLSQIEIEWHLVNQTKSGSTDPFESSLALQIYFEWLLINGLPGSPASQSWWNWEFIWGWSTRCIWSWHVLIIAKRERSHAGPIPGMRHRGVPGVRFRAPEIKSVDWLYTCEKLTTFTRSQWEMDLCI